MMNSAYCNQHQLLIKYRIVQKVWRGKIFDELIKYAWNLTSKILTNLQ